MGHTFCPLPSCLQEHQGKELAHPRAPGGEGALSPSLRPPSNSAASFCMALAPTQRAWVPACAVGIIDRCCSFLSPP